MLRKRMAMIGNIINVLVAGFRFLAALIFLNNRKKAS